MPRAQPKTPPPSQKTDQKANEKANENANEKKYTAAEKKRIRDGLKQRLAELQGEMDESSAAAGDLRLDELQGDDADTAAMVSGQEHESAVSEGLQRKMAEVEHALLRLSHGDYGRCERCGRMIPARRLVAFPSATLCVECKQLEER